MPYRALRMECLAQDMAKAEGAMLLAAVCARFDVALAPGQVWCLTEWGVK